MMILQMKMMMIAALEVLVVQMMILLMILQCTEDGKRNHIIGDVSEARSLHDGHQIQAVIVNLSLSQHQAVTQMEAEEGKEEGEAVKNTGTEIKSARRRRSHQNIDK
jgi:hypothetical protein